MALALLLAPLFLGLGLVAVVAWSHRSAWVVRRRGASLGGYRDRAQVLEALDRRPLGGVLAAGLAVGLGCTAIWPLLVMVARVRHGAGLDPLEAALGGTLSAALLAVVVAGLALVARRPGSIPTARWIAAVAITIGVLVAGPMVAWPGWFGPDGERALAAAAAIFAALGGAVLARAASIVHGAELELFAEPALFDAE